MSKAKLVNYHIDYKLNTANPSNEGENLRELLEEWKENLVVVSDNRIECLKCSTIFDSRGQNVEKHLIQVHHLNPLVVIELSDELQKHLQREREKGRLSKEDIEKLRELNDLRNYKPPKYPSLVRDNYVYWEEEDKEGFLKFRNQYENGEIRIYRIVETHLDPKTERKRCLELARLKFELFGTFSLASLITTSRAPNHRCKTERRCNE